MLMKFADLSQSDGSNWVMWLVKDPSPTWVGRVSEIEIENALENKLESI